MPEPMTGRERMLTAFARRKADHVPVSPDISAMVPVRLSGRPFDEMFLDGRPHNGYATASVAEAYVNAVKYYGMDGWYIYGSMPEIAPPERPQWQSRVESLPQGGQVRYETTDTPYGPLSRESLFPITDPPWDREKPIKDLHADWPKLRSVIGEDGNWQWSETFEDRDRIGELGIYSICIGIPQDWWFFQRHGGFKVMYGDYLHDDAYIQEIFEFYQRYALARVEAACVAGADEVLLGGSASSLSVSSPRNFRKYDLPFVQKAVEVCKRHGVFSHLHVCGRSRQIVEMVLENSEVDVIEPLEEPPGGDVDITDIKRRYGERVCLKGNINTFEFMLRATPEQVEEKAKRLIDTCGADGGFVLSTGDQCGRDTPDANIFKLVEVGCNYGRY
jgi:uroporphyrinogen decarboxylase